jgi:hypothetical protein
MSNLDSNNSPVHQLGNFVDRPWGVSEIGGTATRAVAKHQFRGGVIGESGERDWRQLSRRLSVPPPDSSSSYQAVSNSSLARSKSPVRRPVQTRHNPASRGVQDNAGSCAAASCLPANHFDGVAIRDHLRRDLARDAERPQAEAQGRNAGRPRFPRRRTLGSPRRRVRSKRETTPPPARGGIETGDGVASLCASPRRLPAVSSFKARFRITRA